MGMLKVTIKMLFAIVLYTYVESVHSQCFPKNWSTSWSHIDNVWFTHLSVSTTGIWSEMAAKCSEIEPGRTTIASVRSDREAEHLQKSNIRGQDWYIGGIRLARKWYWFGANKNGSITQIQQTNFSITYPHRRTLDIYCARFLPDNMKWYETKCGERYSALCELRC